MELFQNSPTLFMAVWTYLAMCQPRNTLLVQFALFRKISSSGIPVRTHFNCIVQYEVFQNVPPLFVPSWLYLSLCPSRNILTLQFEPFRIISPSYIHIRTRSKPVIFQYFSISFFTLRAFKLIRTGSNLTQNTYITHFQVFQILSFQPNTQFQLFHSKNSHMLSTCFTSSVCSSSIPVPRYINSHANTALPNMSYLIQIHTVICRVKFSCTCQ